MMTEKKKKDGRGRPPIEITDKDRAQVERMAGLGLTQPQIANICGFSEDTLQRHFSAELANGVGKLNSAVAANLYSIATSRDNGAVAAAIFWMKTRGRWKETNHHEVTGADGGAIEVETKTTIDASKLTPEQREALRAAALAVKAKG